MNDLFDFDRIKDAAAHRDDPETSHIAARRHRASGAMSENQQRVFNALTVHGPCTACELFDRMTPESKEVCDRTEVSRRLPELERSGKIQRLDARICTVAGTRQTVWDVVGLETI